MWEQPSANIARSYTNGTRTYYNFRAATAGTTNASFTNGDASGSVCPRGWKLPTGGGSGEYYKLISTRYRIESNSVGSTKVRNAPLSFNYAGSYNYSSGSVSYASLNGYYWSGTVISSSNAYRLFFSDSNVNPVSNYYRGYGFALRCIARVGCSNITREGY